MSNVVIIGVSGGSASGKTTVANQIKEACKDSVVLLSHDFYYTSLDHLTMKERITLNFDHPNAFDTDRLIADLEELKKGHAIERPVYSYTEYTRLKETVTVNPVKVIILEGLLIFENAKLRDLMDIKVFVDTDADERLMRRIMRDVNERGRSVDSVINQYTDTVKPMHEQFIEPYKKYADIIMPRGGNNHVAVDMLIHRVKALCSE